MKQVNYIFVNETGSENAARALRCSPVSELRHSVVIDPCGLSHGELLDQLVRLRRHHPDAKILGVSETDPTSAHAPIRVSPAMNALRRALSDLP